MIPVRSFDTEEYLLTITRKGVIKKTPLVEYGSTRKDGIIALSLDENDELIDVKLTNGKNEVIIGTKEGKAIRFAEEEVRSMGRAARGVRGISLSEKDEVIGIDTIEQGADVLVVTEKGFGKRSHVDDYRRQGRGGKGIMTIRPTKRNGHLVGIKVVKPGDELMLITAEGIIIRLDVDGISTMGRSTQGVRLMRLDENDHVVAVAKVVTKDED